MTRALIVINPNASARVTAGIDAGMALARIALGWRHGGPHAD